MLTIRPSQLDALARTRLLDRTCQFLRREMGAEIHAIPEPELREVTGRRLAAAQKCHLRTERGMVRFVCLSMILGDGFESRPEHRALFNQPGESSDAHLELLFTELAKTFKTRT